MENKPGVLAQTDDIYRQIGYSTSDFSYMSACLFAQLL